MPPTGLTIYCSGQRYLFVYCTVYCCVSWPADFSSVCTNGCSRVAGTDSPAPTALRWSSSQLTRAQITPKQTRSLALGTSVLPLFYLDLRWLCRAVAVPCFAGRPVRGVVDRSFFDGTNKKGFASRRFSIRQKQGSQTSTA